MARGGDPYPTRNVMHDHLSRRDGGDTHLSRAHTVRGRDRTPWTRTARSRPGQTACLPTCRRTKRSTAARGWSYSSRRVQPTGT